MVAQLALRDRKKNRKNKLILAEKQCDRCEFRSVDFNCFNNSNLFMMVGETMKILWATNSKHHKWVEFNQFRHLNKNSQSVRIFCTSKSTIVSVKSVTVLVSILSFNYHYLVSIETVLWMTFYLLQTQPTYFMIEKNFSCNAKWGVCLWNCEMKVFVFISLHTVPT